MNKITRLIIADDHLIFIEGLKRLLLDEEYIEVINVANNGKQLVQMLSNGLQPDMILMDINMPKMDGLTCTQFIKEAHPHIKIVMLSTYQEKHLIEKAKQSRADGYLLKNCGKDELLRTIKIVQSGKSYFTSGLESGSQVQEIKDPFQKQFNLTKRELQIIQLIKLSNSNQQMADQLFLSVYTVETHRKNIMQKLELNSPASLMRFILENNL